MRILAGLRGRGRYTLFGALFGALFPIVSLAVLTFVSREVTILFAVICTAPLFLGLFARFAGVRQDRLDTINRELEALVQERTRSIQGLLDVSGQGFLSFDKDLRVSAEYSRECRSIFGGPIEGRQIDELLYAGTRARTDFRSGLHLYFSGSAKPDVVFDLLDHTITLGQKTVKAEYRAISENRVMAILTDITEDLRRQEESRAETEKRSLLLKVIANRRSFGAFDREAGSLFEAMAKGRAVDADLLREIHSFKGNAGFLGFRKTQESAHALEELIADAVSLGQEAQPASTIEALREAFASERQVITEALGAEWMRDGDMVEIPRPDYLVIEGHVKKQYPADRVLISALEGHRMTPLSGLFERFPIMARDLAARMGKRVQLTVSGGSLRVAADEFEHLVSSFSHVLRNMIDHGIEPPPEREAAGKPPAGQVRMEVAEAARELVFTLSDDGRGVALADVERRGRELGLIPEGTTPSSAELLALIFRDSFSTSREVSSISGRGVGLPAVREAVRRMGGRISMKTAAGKGTTFTVTVPRRRQGEAGR